MIGPSLWLGRKMTRVFLNDDQKLSPEDLHHLFHVLRMTSGDSLEAVYKRDLYRARLTDHSAQDGSLALEEKLEARQKDYRVFLLQGLAKGQKWEEVLEHGTEVGIDVFVAIQMKRSLRKVDHKWDKLKNRWEKIVEKAAKQSKQVDIPQVYPPMTLEESLEILPKDSLILVCYEEEKDHFMKDYIQGQEKNIALIIGPEGGLDPEEVDLIKARGGHPVSLGKNILRTETAPLIAGDRVYCLMEER